MKFSIKRDARSGRFATAKIIKHGKVEAKSSANVDHMVTEFSFDQAKKAANASLRIVEAK